MNGSWLELFSIWVFERLDFLLDLGVLGGFSRVFQVDWGVDFTGLLAIGSFESRDKRREDRRGEVGVETEIRREDNRRFGVWEMGV